LGLHNRDKDILTEMKSFFNNCGGIYPINHNKGLLYQVRNPKDINNRIIPHFEKYPLITKKQSDFVLFKNIVELMNKGEHFKKDSLINIINLKASLNKGLSDKLKLSFPEVKNIDKPEVNFTSHIDSN
jgi:hypothetical protein